MTVLFIILQQLPTVVMVKLWQLIYCVEIYDFLNYDLSLIFKKIACIRNLCQFTCNLQKIQIFSVVWLKSFLWCSNNLYWYTSSISCITVFKMSVLTINHNNGEKSFKTKHFWDVQVENENHGQLTGQWRCIV